MFLTIIAGVTIFVISQFILKLALEPIVELKKVLGEISALFLREQASITNGNATEATRLEIIRLSSMILAARQAIILYGFFSLVLRMPSKQQLINGCYSLNLLSYIVTPELLSTGQKISHTREIHEK